MRRTSDARMIKVDKAKLITKIKENKAQHIIDYDKAVEVFKKEAAEQLQEAQQALTDGNFKEVKIHLTVPQNRSDEYDKIVKTFEWEVEELVDLSQGEFNEYVLDELDFAVSARFANTMYTQKWAG